MKLRTIIESDYDNLPDKDSFSNDTDCGGCGTRYSPGFLAADPLICKNCGMPACMRCKTNCYRCGKRLCTFCDIMQDDPAKSACGECGPPPEGNYSIGGRSAENPGGTIIQH